MSTLMSISFSTWVHTIFSCLWTVLLFLTWLYTRFWLYMMQKHPYCEKLGMSLQTRPLIRCATMYDRLSLTYVSRMTILSSTLNRIESRRFISKKMSENSIFRWKNDTLSLSTTFSQLSRKNLIKIYEPWLNNGITSKNIPLKAECDIAWWYKCQIEIAMPTFTFGDVRKQPYKYADIKILRTVDLTVCILVTSVTAYVWYEIVFIYFTSPLSR